MSTAVQTMNMTPGSTADCYLPGCTGISGGICAGMTTGALNETVWWCCAPYAATCRGGAQISCRPELSSSQITCSNSDSGYQWCCSSALETCPPVGGLEGSCIPRNYPNPAVNGPVWGPGAVGNATVSSTAVSSTSSVASTTSSVPTTSSSPTATGVPPAVGSPPLSLGAAAALGAVGMLVVGGLVAGGWWIWARRRKVAKGGGVPAEMHAEEMVRVFEIQGESLHELESGTK